MKNYPKGIFKADIKALRKKEDRYFLILEIDDENATQISIDVHDSICETAGVSTISHKLKSSIFENLPATIRISNLNGYWKIQNEAELLSDAISKSL